MTTVDHVLMYAMYFHDVTAMSVYFIFTVSFSVVTVWGTCTLHVWNETIDSVFTAVRYDVTFV
jgi:hypothetical protein